MVIKEWRCTTHGDFEGSHPICPALGCRSQKVERVFLTAPGVKSEFVTRHEKGVAKLAASYGQSDFRTAKAGEMSKKQELGQKLLWGNDIQKTLRMDMNTLTAGANAPIVHPDGSLKAVPHGMRQAATELGITHRVLPPAGELTVSRHEPKMKKATAA